MIHVGSVTAKLHIAAAGVTGGCLNLNADVVNSHRMIFSLKKGTQMSQLSCNDLVICDM